MSMRFRCFNIDTTGDPAPDEVIVELTAEEIEEAGDLGGAIHEALFDSLEDGLLEDFDYEPLTD